MNIGIDFNTKTTKAAFLVNGIDPDNCKIYEVRNILAFVNGKVFPGDEGFNKFLTEKNSLIYDLDQIIELNGVVIDKEQISVERCLAVIFASILNKIKTYLPDDGIDNVCITIPYDKYYYWHSLIERAFSLIGVKDIRIMSQPAAFFGQSNIDSLLVRLNHGSLSREEQKKNLDRQAIQKYARLPLYKKLFSKKPKNDSKNRGTEYLFVSISQDNTNVSLVNYGDGVLYTIGTQYTNTITRRKIEQTVLDFFISEIGKDSRNFALEDPKNIVRILDAVNEFLKTSQVEETYELNLPFVLCKDGSFQTLDTKINLGALHNFLATTFDDLVKSVEKLASEIFEVEKKKNFESIIILGDSFIQQSIKELVHKAFVGAGVAFGNEKLLAIGAFNYSRVLTGKVTNFLALEVIPFSILVRLSGGEFIEMTRKDSAIPTSKNHTFEITGENKSKFVEIHLTTKEGDVFQSLNVWKIQALNNRVIEIRVNVGADMEIGLEAYSESGQKLFVQKGNTFSFGGTGFEIGIKGKDIRQYVLNQFNYLNAVLENKEITVFEPDGAFYSMLKEGDPFKALRYLGRILNLKSLPDVEMAESKFFEEQGIGGFISGSKISIPKLFTKDPFGFGYILAHELAHYILIHEEKITLDDEQENEILTEIFVIYCGMGKLFLNGFRSKDAKSSSLHTHGYLDEKLIKFIHQIYFQKFNIEIPSYKENLTEEALKILDEFID